MVGAVVGRLGFSCVMEELYDLALENMENAVHKFASRVRSPQRIPYKDSFVFRYTEKTVHQALVQKLARMVSSLHAARLLMEHGFVQEQASLQRILDEIHEDITFLSFGVICLIRKIGSVRSVGHGLVT